MHGLLFLCRSLSLYNYVYLHGHDLILYHLCLTESEQLFVQFDDERSDRLRSMTWIRCTIQSLRWFFAETPDQLAKRPYLPLACEDKP